MLLFEKREDIPKFAHKAYLSEIEENGSNLNIPRYVDTFEEEKKFDIPRLKEELVGITEKKKTALEKVNATMKLLGL